MYHLPIDDESYSFFKMIEEKDITIFTHSVVCTDKTASSASLIRRKGREKKTSLINIPFDYLVM